jgi:putative two-component system response regulator
MRIEELLELEARLKQCVLDDNGDRFSTIVTQLCEELHIPALGDATLVVRDQITSDLIARCGDLVFSTRQPKPEALCAELLICAASPLLTSTNLARFYQIVCRALQLAEASGQLPVIRRAANNCAVGAITADPTMALVYAARAYVISLAINDNIGQLSAIANVSGALVSLGLHRECVNLAMPRPTGGFQSTLSERNVTAAYLANKATSYLALNQHATSFETASEALNVLGHPSTPVTIWLAVNTEYVRLRCSIQFGDDEAVLAIKSRIDSLASGHRAGRIAVICEHAAAAYDCHVNDASAAIQRLLAMRSIAKSISSLYHDNLTQLQEAYSSIGDYAGALACLSEHMQHRSHEQIARVASILSALGGAIQTVSPAHEIAAPVISSVRGKPVGHYKSSLLKCDGTAMQETFERLAVAAELNEDDSGRHIYRVGRLTGLLAVEIGYDAAAADAMDRAARLHDIGKLGLPGALVARAEALSAAEHKVMREHAGTGRKILQQANDPAFDLACDIAQSHHERWDGRGYPQKLKHAAIPESARMVALTEAFDVLTHGRAYQPAVTVVDALLRLQQASGTHFEPRLVDALLKVVARLQQAHGGDDAALSDYLGDAGTASSFLQARDSMQDLVSALSPAR